MKLRQSALVGLSLVFGVSVHAQTLPNSIMNDPAKIPVSNGHKLIELPAKYIIVRERVETKPRHIISLPPIYRQTVKDGVMKREIVQPGKTVERLISGPVKWKLVRKIDRPVSYGIVDENGVLVSRWEWVKGELIIK